jgi:hypothetical protein
MITSIVIYVFVLEIVRELFFLHLKGMTSLQLRLKAKDILEVALFINVSVPRVVLVLVRLRLVRKVLCGSLDGDALAIFIARCVVTACFLILSFFRTRAADRALRFLFNGVLLEADLLLACFASLILSLFLELLKPGAGVSWEAVLESTQIMNVPHGVLPELANVDTIDKTNELDVMIVRACHNEFFFIYIFSVSDLHDVDAIDDSAVYLDEPFLVNFVRS